MSRYGFDRNKVFLFGDGYIDTLIPNIANRFWKDVFRCFSNFLSKVIFSQTDIPFILRQPIWHNSHIQIGNSPVCYQHWIKRGVTIVNDLLDFNQNFLPYNRFLEVYGIPTNFLEYHGIISAIRCSWGDILFSCNIKKLDSPVNNLYNVMYTQCNFDCRNIYQGLISTAKYNSKAKLKWISQFSNMFALVSWDFLLFSTFQLHK